MANRFERWDTRWKEGEKDKTWKDGVKKMELNQINEGVRPIVDIYSPPRVTPMTEKLGWINGLELDLTQNDDDGEPWDFNRKDKRDEIKTMIEKKEALLLTDSPMCSAFSQLQHISFSKVSEEDIK